MYERSVWERLEALGIEYVAKEAGAGAPASLAIFEKIVYENKIPVII